MAVSRKKNRRATGSAAMPAYSTIPMELEIILYDHFRLQSMRYLHSQRSLSQWRRCLHTYFESIGKAIDQTVVGDARHKSDLLEFCYAAAERVQKARSRDDVLRSAVGSLTLLCFRLLGGAAVQDGERRGSRRDWSLARHRSMTYTVTAGQMATRILDHARYWRADLPDTIPEYDELFKRRWKEFSEDNWKFVQWFRDKYPKSYAAIF